MTRPAPLSPAKRAALKALAVALALAQARKDDEAQTPKAEDKAA